MILIHVTDTHLAPIGTRYRVDDYPTAVLSKLEQVVSAARDLNVPVVHTGDFYDLQNPRGIPRDFIDRLHTFVLKSGVDWIMLAGQHDLPGRTPSTAQRSPINLFRYHKAVQSCDVLQPVTVHRGLGLVGVNYHPGILTTLTNLCSYKGQLNIVAAHAMVTDHEVPWEHVTTEALAGLPARVVLTGDYHTGYPAHVVGGTLFVNPGALARVDRNEAERQPAYAVVDVDGQTAEYVPVQSETGATVFDLSRAQAAAEVIGARQEFASRLSAVDFGSDGVSWPALVQDLKEDEPVVSRARDYYDQAATA